MATSCFHLSLTIICTSYLYIHSLKTFYKQSKQSVVNTFVCVCVYVCVCVCVCVRERERERERETETERATETKLANLFHLAGECHWLSLTTEQIPQATTLFPWWPMYTTTTARTITTTSSCSGSLSLTRTATGGHFHCQGDFYVYTCVCLGVRKHKRKRLYEGQIVKKRRLSEKDRYW